MQSLSVGDTSPAGFVLIDTGLGIEDLETQIQRLGSGFGVPERDHAPVLS